MELKIFDKAFGRFRRSASNQPATSVSMLPPQSLARVPHGLGAPLSTSQPSSAQIEAPETFLSYMQRHLPERDYQAIAEWWQNPHMLDLLLFELCQNPSRRLRRNLIVDVLRRMLSALRQVLSVRFPISYFTRRSDASGKLPSQRG